MLSSALISELQEILREEFGLKLTDSEASATGESLVKVYETLGTITTRINHPTDDSKTIPLSNEEIFWEDDRDHTKLTYSDTEWLSEYPKEIGQIFTDKIRELRREAQSLRRSLIRKVRLITETETDEFAGWFAKEWLKATDAAKIAELEAKVSHFKRLLSISSSGPSNWDRLVSEARETPILEIVTQDCRLRRCGKSYLAHCPLHEERTPSFHVYPDSGHFHCFGCGAHGDVITYVMLRNQLSFKEAVQMLAGGHHA